MPAPKKPQPTTDTVSGDAPVISQTDGASADAPAESPSPAPVLPPEATPLEHAKALGEAPWWVAGVLQHTGWTAERVVSRADFVAALAEVKGAPNTSQTIRLK